jgi:hypothetical protein
MRNLDIFSIRGVRYTPTWLHIHAMYLSSNLSYPYFCFSGQCVWHSQGGWCSKALQWWAYCAGSFVLLTWLYVCITIFLAFVSHVNGICMYIPAAVETFLWLYVCDYQENWFIAANHVVGGLVYVPCLWLVN